MKIAGLVAGAAVALTATNALAFDLVQNGDFTSLTNGVGELNTNTNATGWSTTGYNFVFVNGGDAVPQGGGDLSLWTASNGGANTWNGLAAGPGNFLAMDGDYGTSPVTQTISGLKVGQTYDLTFDYAFSQQYGWNGPTTQDLTASIGSTTWTSSPDFDLPSNGFSGWFSQGLSFTATSSSETLSFLAYGNVQYPPFALVSNVAIGAPEPGAWVLMIIGVGALGAVARRRRAAVPAAA